MDLKKSQKLIDTCFIGMLILYAVSWMRVPSRFHWWDFIAIAFTIIYFLLRLVYLVPRMIEKIFFGGTVDFEGQDWHRLVIWSGGILVILILIGYLALVYINNR
jgi:hypothetical protein